MLAHVWNSIGPCLFERGHSLTGCGESHPRRGRSVTGDLGLAAAPDWLMDGGSGKRGCGGGGVFLETLCCNLTCARTSELAAVSSLVFVLRLYLHLRLPMDYRMPSSSWRNVRARKKCAGHGIEAASHEARAPVAKPIRDHWHFGAIGLLRHMAFLPPSNPIQSTLEGEWTWS